MVLDKIVIDYQLVRDTDSCNFNNEIHALINQGYIPHSQTCIERFKDEDGEYVVFTLAMILYETEEQKRLRRMDEMAQWTTSANAC